MADAVIDISGFTRWGLRILGAGVLFVLLGVVLYRFGVSGFQLSLLVIAIGVVLSALAVLCGLIGLAVAVFGSKSGVMQSLFTVVLGLGILVVPVNAALKGGAVPPIHDISTDLSNPPEFSAVVSRRGPDSNPLSRTEPGDLADLQRAAYPGLETLVVEAEPAEVFEEARALVDSRGWLLVAAEPSAGRIEATDTTAVMGFKDDVVIRIEAAEGGGTAIDMRSVSRVGQSDLGTNAARIEAFLADLKARIEQTAT